MNKLAELDALYEAATPGEWHSEGIGGIQMDGTRDGYMVASSEQRKIAAVYMTTTSRTARMHDAALIAALHNSYPALRAVVEAAVEFRDAWNVDSSVRMQVAGQRLRDSVGCSGGFPWITSA